MLHKLRWFKPHDLVSVHLLRQVGGSGIATALHQLLVGVVWPTEEIRAHQQIIEADNRQYSDLHWAVVESSPVHEDVKQGLPSRTQYVENYKESLRNLAACGIRTVCYKLDSSRTHLTYQLPGGSRALRFVWQDFAVFDLCILGRAAAENDYELEVAAAARTQFAAMSPAKVQTLSVMASEAARYITGAPFPVDGSNSIGF